MSNTNKGRRIVSVLNIIFRLALGGMLILGAFKKFEKPMPSPTALVEQIKTGKLKTDNIPVLKIKNYIFGLKQTNYFWQFLGIVEFVTGILLISQFFGLLGAIIAMPITIHIFLFHIFLEPNDTFELVETFLLFAVNVWLILYDYPKWKAVLFTKQIFN